MNNREVVQHIDDIEIPVIEITAGWAAEDCKTIEQCNDAFAYLMAAVAGIEFQIDMELIKPKPAQDRVWLARASCALKYKRAALQIVNQKRGIINQDADRAFKERRDGKLLAYVRSVTPEHQFLEWLRASGIGIDIDSVREAA